MTQSDLLNGFRLAGRTVRPLQGRVEGLSTVVRLEPRVMDLLVFLAANQGQVVTRENMIKRVWHGTLVTDDVISRSVYLIRKALSDGNGVHGAPVIATIPKRGYRLVAPVTPLAAADRTAGIADAAAAPDATDPALAVPPMILEAPPANLEAPPLGNVRSRTKFAVAATLLAGAVLAIFAWRNYAPSLPAAAPQPVAATAPPQAAHAGRQSLVILPLVSSDGSDEATRIAVGLSDDILSGLSAIEGLRVVGRVSAARVRANHKSYQEIGRELNTTTVLEGSVQGRADEITLNIRLINTETGLPFRDKTYSGNFGMSRALQASVVNDVILALGLPRSISVAEGAHNEASPEAYRLFLEGRYYALENSPGAFQQAHDYFSQAVKADGKFARGWAELAVCDMLMVDFGNRSLDAATLEAAPAFERALELEPELAEAHAAAGLVALYNRRFEESAEELRRATALRPSFTQAHMWLGRVFMAQLEVRRAVTAFERASDLEPQAPIVALNLGLALDLEGQYDSAARVLQEAVNYDPKFANLYWALAHVESELGQSDRAAAAYRTAIDLGAEYSALFGGYSVLLGDMQDPDGALAALTHGEAINANDPSIWAARFNLAALTGRSSQALDLRAARAGQEQENIWQGLAMAKLQMVRGNPAAALKIYGQSHAQEHLSDPELTRELEILGGPGAILDLACAYQLTGAAARADGLIEQAEKAMADDRARGVNPGIYDYLMAAAAAMRGDQARAAALVHSAADRGWQRYAWFKIDPRFSRMQDREQVLAALSASKDKIANAQIH